MMVILGSKAHIGLLGGHKPLIVMLRRGAIDPYHCDRVTEQLSADGGFRCLPADSIAKVRLDHVTYRTQIISPEGARVAVPQKALA
jgi:hypothetical protein